MARSERLVSNDFLTTGEVAMKVMRDDQALFREMMTDYKAKESFQADSFWKNYERANVRYIENFGLRDFFQKPSSFGSILSRKSLFPTLIGQGLGILINKFFKAVPASDVDWRNKYLNYFKLNKEDPQGIRQIYGTFLYTVLRNLPGGESIDSLEDDLAGNPSEVIVVGDKKYSLPFLLYFWRVLLMRNWIPFESSKYIYEIGMGYGGFADVLLKMYPHIHVCLTDIPPQLYMAEQYLKTIFPGQVLGYRETKDLPVISRDTFGHNRIIIVPPWNVSKIFEKTFDGFTNQNSFQEMSPGTCEKYCSSIQKIIRKWIFLFEQRQGCGGVKEPVTRQHYIDFLNEFQLTKEINLVKSVKKDGTTADGEAYLFHRI